LFTRTHTQADGHAQQPTHTYSPRHTHTHKLSLVINDNKLAVCLLSEKGGTNTHAYAHTQRGAIPQSYRNAINHITWAHTHSHPAHTHTRNGGLTHNKAKLSTLYSPYSLRYSPFLIPVLDYFIKNNHN